MTEGWMAGLAAVCWHLALHQRRSPRPLDV